jgi:hypothetical protein
VTYTDFMRARLTIALFAGIAMWSIRADAQVRVTMADGHVTLSAKNATVPQILAEWARVGQTRIVNAERLTGAPLSIELNDMPEAQALDIVLRNAGGYLLAPRPVADRAASMFDRILVVPPSSAPRAAVAPPTPTFQPRANQMPFDGDDPPDPARAPVTRFPQNGQPGAPPVAVPPGDTQQAPVSSAVPFAPQGVARPGMMMPAPSPGPGPGTPTPGMNMPQNQPGNVRQPQ